MRSSVQRFCSCGATCSFFSDGVRLREERRKEVGTKNLSSRRSSTDSSEEGFNLNVRDLKVSEVSHSFLQVSSGSAEIRHAVVVVDDDEQCRIPVCVHMLADLRQHAQEDVSSSIATFTLTFMTEPIVPVLSKVFPRCAQRLLRGPVSFFSPCLSRWVECTFVEQLYLAVNSNSTCKNWL